MKAATLLLALIATSTAWASTPKISTISDLASELQAQRETCSSMAMQAKKDYDFAIFQARLDRDTAALKAEMDARVYAVGHGRRQTTEYYAQLLQNVAAEQQAKDKANSDAFFAAGENVTRCIAQIKEQGKSIYVAFKQKPSSKSARHQAEALISAWLTNIDEINTSKPNGGDVSFNAWKAAKTQAEVSSL